MENDFELFLKENNITEQDINDWMKKMDVDHFVETKGKEYYKIKSKIHGNGLFSSNDLKVGDNIGEAGIGQKRTSLGRYTNHSGNPNIKFIRKDVDGLFIVKAVAIKDIKKDEEFLVDYRHKELNQIIDIKNDIKGDKAKDNRSRAQSSE